MLFNVTSFPERLMKRFEILLLVSLGILAMSHSAPAQSGRVKEASPTVTAGDNKPSEEKSDLNDARTAAKLFEDADTYTQRKFAEFEKLKMPYDQRLEEKIKQEQRDLATRHATILAARKPEGQDVYYLGLLYNLARNFDAALDVMRRFLTENKNAAGEPAQNAPQIAEDRYALENWLVAGYFKNKDYAHALPHAQELWNAARLAGKKKT